MGDTVDAITASFNVPHDQASAKNSTAPSSNPVTILRDSLATSAATSSPSSFHSIVSLASATNRMPGELVTPTISAPPIEQLSDPNNTQTTNVTLADLMVHSSLDLLTKNLPHKQPIDAASDIQQIDVSAYVTAKTATTQENVPSPKPFAYLSLNPFPATIEQTELEQTFSAFLPEYTLTDRKTPPLPSPVPNERGVAMSNAEPTLSSPAMFDTAVTDIGSVLGGKNDIFGTEHYSNDNIVQNTNSSTSTEPIEITDLLMFPAIEAVSSTPPTPSKDAFSASLLTPKQSLLNNVKSPDLVDSPQAEAVLSFFHSPPKKNSNCETPLVSDTISEAVRMGGGQESPRPAAKVPEQQLEHLEKTSIYALCTPVSWCSDTAVEDVREMILCACDAIVNTGFVLLEVIEVPDEKDNSPGIIETQLDGGTRTLRYRLGRRYEFEEFHQLLSGKQIVEYHRLCQKWNSPCLLLVLGDRWRRLKIRIDPLLHVESTKAIEVMRRGANLLRHTDMGFPHLRQFQLSADRERLLWYSSDASEKTAVRIKTIREIRLGQTSPLFHRYKLPALEHLSFSVFYDASDNSPLAKSVSKLIPIFSDRQPWMASLDITCKDETEFDHCVCGLKALAFMSNQLKISKEELLSHSRRFRRTLEMNNATIHFSNLPAAPNNQETIGLEECLELPLHCLADLEAKRERLRDNVTKTRKKIKEFDSHYNQEGTLGRTFAADDNILSPIRLDGLSSSDCSSMSPASPSSSVIDNEVILSSPKEDSRSASATVSTTHPQASFFQDLSAAEDDRLEYIRMQELISAVDGLILQSQDELKEYRKMVSKRPQETIKKIQETVHSADAVRVLKHVNQLLWKAEVDLENVEDMLRRLTARRLTVRSALVGQFFTKNLADVNINEELHKVGEQISTAFVAFFSAASDTAAGM